MTDGPSDCARMLEREKAAKGISVKRRRPTSEDRMQRLEAKCKTLEDRLADLGEDIIYKPGVKSPQGLYITSLNMLKAVESHTEKDYNTQTETITFWPKYSKKLKRPSYNYFVPFGKLARFV